MPHKLTTQPMSRQQSLTDSSFFQQDKEEDTPTHTARPHHHHGRSDILFPSQHKKERKDLPGGAVLAGTLGTFMSKSLLNQIQMKTFKLKAFFLGAKTPCIVALAE